MATPTPSLKLIYFDLPGRGEAIRLILAYGNILFTDFQFSRTDDWPAIKPTTPFGQVPVLEIDGKPLAQQAAIERYVAKLAGIYPSDPLVAAKADEAVAFVSDIGDSVRATFAIADKEEGVKARQALAAGPLKQKLERLQQLLEANGGVYFAGSKLTHSDFNIFSYLSTLSSGLLEGIPTDLVKSFPLLKAHHNKIASLPAVKAKYEKVAEGVRVAFKPWE